MLGLGDQLALTKQTDPAPLGGIACDDAICSAIIFERLPGTTEIIVIHHADSRLETFTDRSDETSDRTRDRI
ncbi:MAG TPA: hypothetical protein VMU99_09320 [Acidimicrobiales bacterium]|nr:hypothetical protein [Acidimicrobiales bacterium]